MFKDASYSHIEQLVRESGLNSALDRLLGETEQKETGRPSTADLQNQVSTVCICIQAS